MAATNSFHTARSFVAGRGKAVPAETAPKAIKKRAVVVTDRRQCALI
ncbi:MAG: hypothetical protein MZV63_65275 [Marinilabiliales bacterium]|nr:hypothetical protein [Marinilabiliales bacterium]